MKRPLDPAKLRMMETSARELGHAIGDALKSRDAHIGFALMIFDFEGPEFTWISNAQRDDMIRALREFIHKYETGEAAQTSERKN